jgi:ribosomal protein L31
MPKNEIKKKNIVKKQKTIHPELYILKIISPNGEIFETVTAKKNHQQDKENIFRLEIDQQNHPAWSGNIFSRSASNQNSSRIYNTNLDIFSI